MSGLDEGAIVEAVDICRDYPARDGDVVQALSNCSLSVEVGEFVTVVGPSGCGKSTLLNILGCLDRASRGRYRLAGRSIDGLSTRDWEKVRRRQVGFLFQDAGLIDGLSALANVTLALEYRGRPAAERNRVGRRLLEEMGLGGRTNQPVERLSGGERQRAALARILAISPPLLICDEPTASLDEDNSIRVVEILNDLCARGHTVVCASHDPLVIQAASRVVTMARGRIVGSDA
ncbi:ABC transporter ATP-binding protein [Brevundimonas sp.]|uniref:ABC transporter ATP-binding protein n=1 Tax=Brevundimonas sp. TaxID=1871086 RepID=UPI0028A8BABD|nr:ABC transporter ATP-binding protein [Brevundimonas sp.]